MAAPLHASPPLRRPAPDEAWVGLGSNLGDRAGQLRAAARALGGCVVEVSPVFETSPWGIVEQPWFLNAVVRVRWTDSPRTLLRRCLQIERALGRVRTEKFGPRKIDLDVLLAGDVCVDEPGLTSPHPGVASRRSVLEPWVRLAPELIVPGLDETVAVLRTRAESLPGQIVKPVEDRLC